MLPESLSELLSAYLDGELGARQRKEVVRLLDESEEARCLLGKLERDAAQLRQLPARKVPFDLTNTILGNIAASAVLPRRLPLPASPPAPTRRRFLGWGRYAAAAAVLLAVGIGSLLFLGGAGQGPSEVAVQPEAPALTVPEVTGKTPADSTEAEPGMGPEVPHRPGSHSVFAFPNRQATELHPAHTRVPFIQMVRELDAPALRDQLQEKVKDSACQVDLYCADPGKALEQIGQAFERQGIRINVDPATVERLERQPRASLALYVENVTPREATAIFQDIASAEKARMNRQFSALVVNAGPVMPEDLARVLGGPARDFAPPSQRPLEQGTVGQLVHALPGQGRAGEKVAPYRLAVVVPHEATTRCSEVQSLLDGYREARPGAMPLLLVLWNGP